MKNNILQLHNQSERTVEKIDCPFSMPMSRKERPPMTKPREKTREELQAEIEGGRRKCGSLKIGRRTSFPPSSVHCYENKTRSQKLNLDNKCFQQL